MAIVYTVIFYAGLKIEPCIAVKHAERNRGFRIMSLIRIHDGGGHSLAAKLIGDVRMPTVFPEDVFRELPKLRLRDDDVVIAGWMRSGTHWVFEMVSMLLNNNTETVTVEKHHNMLEYQHPTTLDTLPSRRVFNTHCLFRYLPEDMKTKPCHVIYLLRDPRDATISWYKLLKSRGHYDYTGEWHNFYPLCLRGDLPWGNWFDHVRDWERAFQWHQNLHVHVWVYEDLIKNPVEGLRRLAEFLGTETNEDLLLSIADKCSLERMKEEKLKYEWLENGANVHYLKGKVGTWKEWFTVEQYEMFEKMYREKMAGSRFEERYKGPVGVL